MRLGSIGRTFLNDNVQNFKCDSHQSLLDFDIVMFDLEGMKGGLDQNTLNRRRAEILDLMKLGRTVVVFLSYFGLEALFPIKGVTTEHSLGHRVDFRGPDELKEFWTVIQSHMTYHAYMKGTFGRPFLFVAETEKPTATWIQHERGNIVLLPQITSDFSHSKQYVELCNLFVSAVVKLHERFRLSKAEFTLPPWSTQYGWDSEIQVRSKLAALRQQAADLSRTIEISARELEAEEKLKILFTAKGDILADAVVTAFRALGQ